MSSMNFNDVAMAVFAGNLLTIWFLYGLWMFNKHDTEAPWSAYGACLIPIVMLMATFYLNGIAPPQFDAIAPQ